MVKITDDEWKRLDTYLKELKLAGYLVIVRLQETQDRFSGKLRTWDRQKYFLLANIRSSDHYMARVLKLEYNIKAKCRPWRVTTHRHVGREYKHLDSALDRISIWRREYLPLATSGIGDG